MTQKWAPETVVVESARPQRERDAPLNPAVVLSSTFVGTHDLGAEGTQDDGIQYGRFGNPTWSPFESALAELERAELPGLVFASGLAAVSAALELVAPGGTVVMPRHCYLGSLSAARDSAAVGRFDVVTVDIADTDAVNDAVSAAAERHAGTPRAVMLWVESPTNPMLEVADLPAVIAHAKSVDALTVVDNTFATPLGQQPLTVGADVVVHSVTKYLAGHSDVVLGAALTSNADLHEALHHHRSIRGAVAGPWEVWLALRGLRTLALRIERSQQNALELAKRLSDVPGIEVRFPGLKSDPGHARAAAQLTGFGSILCVVLPTSAAALAVTDCVSLWTPATSLGGVESLIERRRRHVHEPHTVPEGLLRLSVGIEHVDDLWADLEQALASALSTR
ncbi:MAG: trans-sulfuration enzyme family protein [Microbacterium gubbeenense]|uniref:trans-sulfuration enzyme family protein n=1 Tax=Microbacterium gubbeenense TaxID=159896 RepID=UPI003F947E4F